MRKKVDWRLKGGNPYSESCACLKLIGSVCQKSLTAASQVEIKAIASYLIKAVILTYKLNYRLTRHSFLGMEMVVTRLLSRPFFILYAMCFIPSGRWSHQYSSRSWEKTCWDKYSDIWAYMEEWTERSPVRTSNESFKSRISLKPALASRREWCRRWSSTSKNHLLHNMK